jgi:hypothetical protein
LAALTFWEAFKLPRRKWEEFRIEPGVYRDTAQENPPTATPRQDSSLSPSRSTYVWGKVENTREILRETTWSELAKGNN